MNNNQKEVFIDEKNNYSPYFGFVLATLCSIVGLIFFFAADNFEFENLIQCIGMMFILIAVLGFGIEITESTKKDSAVNLAFALAFGLSAVMIQDIFPNVSLWALLILLILGMLFFLTWLASLVSFITASASNGPDTKIREKKSPEILEEFFNEIPIEKSRILRNSKISKKGTALFSFSYEFVIACGKFCGAMLSIISFVVVIIKLFKML